MQRFIYLLIATVIITRCCLGQTIERAADAPRPKSPAESAACFRVPDGFELTLIANEPTVVDPTGLAWDANGQLYVCELHGYNLEGHIDITELNKTGELDREVRRIEAEDWAKQAAEPGVYGTIKRLIDGDGDGHMETAVIFADRLPPCYGIIPSRDGVIVTCAPHILFLADRDGDGKAEVRETLFTGFGRGKLERGINNPRLSFDNWIYVSHGGGGKITGPALKGTVQLGNTDFRFRADGSAIEPVTGVNNTFGATMTDYGQRFLITGGGHALYATPLPYRYLLRNPYVASPRSTMNAANYSQVYPASQPHPWRQKRGDDPNWVRFYGAHEAKPNGNFTSACGQLIYRSAQFPDEYRDNHFSCDPQQNLIHRCFVTREGTEYRVRRANPDQQTEFLSSTDGWFRPNNLQIGPDGSIFIVDMYREIIEDYSAIPRFLQQQYGLNQGNDRGRLWKLTWQNAEHRATPKLSSATDGELVELLDHTDAWWRLTAQRLLRERSPLTNGQELREFIARAKSWQGQLHALYLLKELQLLRPTDVVVALKSPHFGLRIHGLRLSEPWLADDSELFSSVIRLQDDPDAHVRLQLALSLGQAGNAQAIATLVKLAQKDGDLTWMPAAILSSMTETPDEFISGLLQESDPSSSSEGLLRSLAATTGAKRDAAEVDRVLALAGQGKPEAAAPLLRGLLEGLERSSAKPMTLPQGADNLAQWIAGNDDEQRELALSISRQLGQETTPAIRKVFAEAATKATDPNVALPLRLAAMKLLRSCDTKNFAPALAAVLQPQHPDALQLAAIESAEPHTSNIVGETMVNAWSQSTPSIQSEILNALLEREDRLPQVLQAVESSQIPASALTPFQRLKLLEHPNPTIQQRSQAIFARLTEASESDTRLSEYLAALKSDANLVRGSSLFKKHCQTCHQIDGEGHAVGPNLTGEAHRADETWVRDVLLPSATIASGYSTYTATTEDGRILSGVLASESATSILLRQQEGKEQSVLRNNLESLRASSVSLMPADFNKQVTPEELRDIIAFARSRIGGPRENRRVLFSDDASFASQLDQGAGKARIKFDLQDDRGAYLVISPKQRYSRNLEGWKFPIRENPASGEYRYLRLTWKSEGAEGLMLELADKGQFPDESQPYRSYHSGRNTTGWASHKLAPEAPEKWTSVTIDLWKDNGNFSLTGVAFTAMGGDAAYDSLELFRSLEDLKP